MKKQNLYSAVQPTNNLTIGNYLGAIKNWVELQDKYKCYYAIADMHAITVRQDPAELRKRTLALAALFIACGIDPEKCTLYVQSQVSAHARLCWVLNTFTYVGEMERMTQFKDKSQKHADNINMGLMDYPVLMAADILLYKAAVVPIGKDQTQHLEIARDIAMRFNKIYKPTFTVPEGVYMKGGAKICDLLDPTKKMSKSSENPNGTIFLSDDKDTIIKKFKRAVTDSDMCVRYDPELKPGVSNLLNIYSIFTGQSVEETEAEFANRGYGDFKLAVGEAVADKLEPIQRKQKDLLEDETYLENILKKGANKASYVANKNLYQIHKKIGFYQISSQKNKKKTDPNLDY